MKKNLHSIVSTFILCVALVCSACTSESKLQIAAAAADMECPIDCGPGMEITSVDVQGGDLVYTCEVNESISGVYDLQLLDSPVVKQATKEALFSQNSSEVQELIEILKDANADIKFKYYGVESGETVTITIHDYEL